MASYPFPLTAAARIQFEITDQTVVIRHNEVYTLYSTLLCGICVFTWIKWLYVVEYTNSDRARDRKCDGTRERDERGHKKKIFFDWTFIIVNKQTNTKLSSIVNKWHNICVCSYLFALEA